MYVYIFIYGALESIVQYINKNALSYCTPHTYVISICRWVPDRLCGIRSVSGKRLKSLAAHTEVLAPDSMLCSAHMPTVRPQPIYKNSWAGMRFLIPGTAPQDRLSLC